MKLKTPIRKTDPRKVEFVGRQYLDRPEIQLFRYNSESYSEEQDLDFDAASLGSPADKTTWLNVHGIHDPVLIDGICSEIKMPRFIIQDILDTNQHTKLQDLGDYLFFSVKSILAGADLSLDIEQISFIVGHRVLYSFQEKKGDHFEHVRVRIREDNGLVRHKGPDFLLFLLLEGILANYFTTVDKLEEAIRENGNPLETRETGPQIIYRIEEYKHKLQDIRKNITALKEAILSIEKGSTRVIKPEQQKFFFDIKDNCLLLQELIDAMELRLDAAENLFFSLQGHRMNQVMTTLTIMAAIFIPLTFMAGIYGMNFRNMPELEWEWGYFSLLGLMVIVTAALVYYFKKRRWF
jgi:magnesium transporter